jgi:hypothetical protein
MAKQLARLPPGDALKLHWRKARGFKSHVKWAAALLRKGPGGTKKTHRRLGSLMRTFLEEVPGGTRRTTALKKRPAQSKRHT